MKTYKMLVFFIVAFMLSIVSSLKANPVNIGSIIPSTTSPMWWLKDNGMDFSDPNIVIMQLGLRAVDINGNVLSSVGNVYQTPVGPWGLQWSIKTDPFGLNAPDISNSLLRDTYTLSIDIDPTSAGQSFVTFNPFDTSGIWFGNYGTQNGDGVQNGALGSYTFAQGTMDMSSSPWSGDGTFDVSFRANRTGQSDSIRLVAGNGEGASSVPDNGSTLILLSAVVVGMISIRRFLPENTPLKIS